VADVEWTDDFSSARNVALDLASGDWVLVIDADERASFAGDFRSLLSAPDVVAGRVRFLVERGLTRYWEPRLVRKRPDVRFRGRIHETIVPDLRAVTAREPARVVDTPVAIDHFGYEGDRTRKHRRDLPLLLKEIEHLPERGFLWYALGVAHQGLGDEAAAESAWQRGIEVVTGSASGDPCETALYAALIDLRHRRSQSCRALLDRAIARRPDDLLLSFLWCRQEIEERRFAAAIPPLERLAAVDPDTFVHPALAFDRRIFAEFAPALLGTCWLHAGDPARAVRWFGIASAARPESGEYRAKLALARARAGVAASVTDR
jgi:tetratricopeptide (TPR) repeat protein